MDDLTGITRFIGGVTMTVNFTQQRPRISAGQRR